MLAPNSAGHSRHRQQLLPPVQAARPPGPGAGGDAGGTTSRTHMEGRQRASACYQARAAALAAGTTRCAARCPVSGWRHDAAHFATVAGHWSVLVCGRIHLVIWPDGEGDFYRRQLAAEIRRILYGLADGRLAALDCSPNTSQPKSRAGSVQTATGIPRHPPRIPGTGGVRDSAGLCRGRLGLHHAQKPSGHQRGSMSSRPGRSRSFAASK